MKLSQLKAKVYQLAEVSTIAQLKAKYEPLRALDMRYKASWEQALVIVQQQTDQFQSWLQNPPDEYQELFAEINEVSAAYTKTLAEAEQLGHEVLAMADSLDRSAAELQDTANQLKQGIAATQQSQKQAELN